MREKNSILLSALAATTLVILQRPTTAQESGELYRANETDLSKAIYSLKEGRSSVDVQLNWKGGGLVFSATKSSQNLYDEEGLKMAARDYAYLKASEFLQGVLVGGGRTYEKRDVQLATGSDVEEKSAERTTQVLKVTVPESMVKAAIVDETFELVPDPGRPNAKMAKSTARIVLSLFDRDHPEQAVLPQMIETVRIAEQRAGFVLASYQSSHPPLPKEAESDPKVAAPVPPTEKVTGLIIDTKGLRMPPVQFPAVVVDGNQNQELFGAIKDLAPDYVSRFGVAGWTRSLTEARELKDRVGEHPIVVKATRRHARWTGAVLVSSDDAQHVLAADAVGKFLNECRVVFVID
jgi:hypothetical protein